MKLTGRQKKLLEVVKLFHGDQVRKYTGEPYWTHPLKVASIVCRHIETEEFGYIEAALCHDIFEDTKYDKHDLNKELLNIGYDLPERTRILNLVTELTDKYIKEEYPTLNREARKGFENMRLGKVSPLAQSIKYADLIDNTSSIIAHDQDFAVVYLKEKRKLLSVMREGDINLFIECCGGLKNSETILRIKRDIRKQYKEKLEGIEEDRNHFRFLDKYNLSSGYTSVFY